MKAIVYNFDHTLISSKKIESLVPLLARLQAHMQVIHAAALDYQHEYCWMQVPFDTKNVEQIQQVIKDKSNLDISAVVVIGIGGSSLGTIAIDKCLRQESTVPLFFVETVDSDATYNVMRACESLLQQKKNIICIVATKSGTTTETIALAQVFIALLQRYYNDTYSQYLVVISQETSCLSSFAYSKGIQVLPVPEKLGGRFSVLSAIGLLPLGLMGYDIKSLLKGAQDLVQECCVQPLHMQSVVHSAIIKYCHTRAGVVINDFFVFDGALEPLGKWYRQLMAESLAKEYDIQGQPVDRVPIPTVSVGSTDLHSMGQLYLAFAQSGFTMFVSVSEPQHTMCVPCIEDLSCVSHIEGKTLRHIMQAIERGIQQAFVERGRPCMSIIIPEKKAYFIGYFLQWCMMEIVYLGSLLQVNSFDQPNVELYKQLTRKILADE